MKFAVSQRQMNNVREELTDRTPEICALRVVRLRNKEVHIETHLRECRAR